MPSKTAFFEAVRGGQAAVVAAALRERPDFVSLVDSSGRTAPHVCAKRAAARATDRAAALATAKALLKAGADVNAVQPIRDDGETPLIYAMRHRRAKFAKWLLGEAADPRLEDRLPDSTLRALLARGARADAVSNDGVTVAALATRAQRRLLGLR